MKQKETIDYVLVAVQVSIWNEGFSYLFIYLGFFALARSGQVQHFFACNSANNAQNVWQKRKKESLRWDQAFFFCRGIDMWGRLGALAERFAVRVLYSYV